MTQAANFQIPTFSFSVMNKISHSIDRHIKSASCVALKVVNNQFYSAPRGIVTNRLRTNIQVDWKLAKFVDKPQAEPASITVLQSGSTVYHSQMGGPISAQCDLQLKGVPCD